MTRQSRRLRIVVALDAAGSKGAALDWALALADPLQDELLLVNTFRAVALPDCRWQPVLNLNSARRLNAARSAHAALAAVRCKSHEIAAECYTSTTDLVVTLLELGSVADLVITDQGTLDASETRQLLRHAPCAVAVIVGAPRQLDTRPITVELDRAELPVGLIRFATEVAHRRDTGLMLAAPFDATCDARATSDWARSDQELLRPALDTLERWRPDVPVSISVHDKGGHGQMRRLLELSQMLLLPRWDGEVRSLATPVLTGPAQALLMVPVPAHAAVVAQPWPLPRPVAVPRRESEASVLAVASPVTT
jgi:nucleotide-binding universal stress UspA family protein